jgi:Spy/CpxP family protein refolding chaperone
MRTLCKVFLTLAVVALLASPALSQQPRPPFGGGFGTMGPVQLLQNKSVQEELKISEDQLKKITDAAKPVSDLQREQSELFRNRDLSREEREKKQTELREKLTKANETVMKDVKGILTSEQSKRLDQIGFQQTTRRGPSAFTEEKLATTLKLTDEQKEKLKVIGEDYSKESREIRGFDEESQKKRAALREAAMEKATAVLTAEQRKSFKEMQGAPFELRIERRPGGGGGAPGTPPGGGGGRPPRPGTNPQPGRIDL